MTIIKYETSSSEFINLPRPIIFLAGPTVRGNQLHLTSWRIAAVEEFKKQGYQGTLILPEFTDKTESDKYRYDLPAWENEGLTISTVNMFWVPRTRELIGLTTNHEFGRWMTINRFKMVYGRPDDAYRIKYLDILWAEIDPKRYSFFQDSFPSLDINIYNTLEATVAASISKAYD